MFLASSDWILSSVALNTEFPGSGGFFFVFTEWARLDFCLEGLM